jgi:hypothetical protein
MLVLIGILIAGNIYKNNNVLSRGILGSITLYLLYYFGQQQKIDVSVESFLENPQKAKYLIFSFIFTIITYWSTMQVYEMIVTLRN